MINDLKEVKNKMSNEYIISKNEAKKIALEACLSDIYNNIRECAEEGKFVYHHGDIPFFVLELLEDQGYKIDDEYIRWDIDDEKEDDIDDDDDEKEDDIDDECIQK